MPASSDDRIEFERVLLAALLTDPPRLAQLRGMSKDWLSRPEHRAIFDAIRSHHELNAGEGRVRYATPGVVDRLVAERFSVKTGDKVKDKRRRILRDAAQSAVDALSQRDKITEHEFLEAFDSVQAAWLDARAKEGIIKLADQYERTGAVGLYKSLNDMASTIAPAAGGSDTRLIADGAGHVLVSYSKAKRTPGSGRILTPFPQMNKVTGGGRRGRMWLDCAFAKDGKTIGAVQLAYHAAVEQGYGAVHFTCEQRLGEAEELYTVRHTHKFIDGGVSARRMEDGALKPSEEAALRAAVKDLRTNPNYGPIRCAHVPYGTTIAEVRSMLDTFAMQHRVDVVVLDHSALFSPSRRGQFSREEKSAATLQEMKQLALDFNGKGCWLIVPHQIKREGYEKALERGYYVATDAAGTSEAERSCDVLMWLLRTPDLKDASEVRMGIAVDRRGPGAMKGWQEWERYESCAILPIEEGE